MLTLKMELHIKICVSSKEPKFSRALPWTPLGPFRASPQTPLLQSSEILNLGVTAQTGNFWLTPLSASFSKDWKIFWSMMWWFQICKCNAISLGLNFKHLEGMSPKVPFFLSRLLSSFKMSSRLILWNLKISGETMFSLIDLMLGWFLNFWIAIFKSSHSLAKSLLHWMCRELTAFL